MKKLYLPKNFKFSTKPNAGFFDVNHYISESYNEGLFNFLPPVVTLATTDTALTLAAEQYKNGTIFVNSHTGATTYTLDPSIPVGTSFTFFPASSSTQFVIDPGTGVSIYFTSDGASSTSAVATHSDNLVSGGSANSVVTITKVTATKYFASTSRKVHLFSED